MKKTARTHPPEQLSKCQSIFNYTKLV